MNFKTILSLAALSLIGANAAPVNNECQCNNRCQGYLVQFSENAYTCLTPANFYTLRGKHCINVKGHFSNQTNIYCVDEENSNVNLCNKSSNGYNYDQCTRNLYFAARSMSLEISIYNEDQVKAEVFCQRRKGYYLESDDEQYVCLDINDKEDNNRPECVTIEGDNNHTYCPSETDTNVDFCDPKKEGYDSEKCFRFLRMAASQNNVKLGSNNKH
ncbi:hypothetical protein BCR32DRAFT_296576 [Anaeromyces robustus]|uniref:Uncharacterized protein n=1 Tax=Anaeromyces robustus TaxID=1754192 RepID=A0A1Y1WR04_9FUNG|nr:hypothetical protein BCR32DRAFT_296576 [Anaeromyces robustus]|eukprot:ORX75957.1 hypothetical protein BCR32DRAFT_296576 [Anaeromyces robustus]